MENTNSVATMPERSSAMEFKTFPFETRPSILVVDDDEMSRSLFALRLQELDLGCDSACSGQAALESLGRRDYDLIFLDRRMPDMDGFTLASLIRRREMGSGRRAVIVALTAEEDCPDKRAEFGLDAYLPKSCRLSEIHDAIGKWRDGTERAIIHRMEDLAGVEQFRKLTRQFLERTDADLMSMDAALARREWEQVERDIHRLKGKTAMFGAMVLSALFFDLERAVKRRASSCRTLLEAAKDELESFRRRVQAQGQDMLAATEASL